MSDQENKGSGRTKKSVLLYLLMLSLMQTQLFGAPVQLTIDDLVQAHNRLYFTRLNHKNLPDSIIVRNIRKARLVFNNMASNGNADQQLLVQKSAAEASYLEASLNYQHDEFDNALKKINLAYAWQDHDTRVLSDLTLVEQSFFGNRFSEKLSDDIAVLRGNILKKCSKTCMQLPGVSSQKPIKKC